MKKLNLFLILVMLGFGLVVVPTAQAVEITTSPCLSRVQGGIVGTATPRVGGNDGSNCGFGPQWNARMAIAPYAQVVAGDSYTFIGISHPSLATAHTSIGVVVEAMDMTTVPDTTAGRAAVFTVSAGETHRVFVINQSHETININNSNFTDTQTHLITTSDASQFGNIRVTSIGTNPTFASDTVDRPGWYRGTSDNTSILRMDNLNQLAMWGVVYQTSNGAGFALEFVGDMHDSVANGLVINQDAKGQEILKITSTGAGRGVN